MWPKKGYVHYFPSNRDLKDCQKKPAALIISLHGQVRGCDFMIDVVNYVLQPTPSIY